MQTGMIVAQISDTHIDLHGPNGAQRLGNLERCMADINRLDPLPDLLIHTGDLAQNGSPTEYEAARRILDALRCPYLVGAGNRDDRDALRAAFPAERYLLPETAFAQYSVDGFPVRFVAIDTLSDASNQGDFCQVRADSLRQALAEEPEKPTVVFMHHPPFEVLDSDYPRQFVSWDSVERLGRALEGHRQVIGMLCGHTHRDTAGEIGGVSVSSMPSVAVDLRLGDYPASVDGVPLYKIHEIDADRGIVGETRAA